MLINEKKEYNPYRAREDYLNLYIQSRLRSDAHYYYGQVSRHKRKTTRLSNFLKGGPTIKACLQELT